MSGMRVPYTDFGKMHDPLRAELDAAWKRVMDREWFIGGEEDEAFEQAFAAYCGTKYCVGVGNGLDALRLILCPSARCVSGNRSRTICEPSCATLAG